MSIPVQYRERIAGFPLELRELIAAELQAGNEIVELASCFPAPPAGAYVKLAKPVTTHSRNSTPKLRFYDRNSSSYSGEFTDATRFFFVLEPPHPPQPPPDMDAIRAEIEARQKAADAALYRDQEAERLRRQEAGYTSRLFVPDLLPASPARVSPLVDRFCASMVIDYERWREGIGYDTSLFSTATSEELVEIETLLLSRPIDDWRDVEALAKLESPRARVKLRAALTDSECSVRVALVQYAAHLLSEEERTEVLVDAVHRADTYGGLTQALLEIENHHPPRVIDALLRGVLRGGRNAIHFAAMLMYLHGKAPSAFDWEQRPFFLQFDTDNPTLRERLFRELCRKIGRNCEGYLQG
ncbi:MAG: hypothetical protein JNN07_08550 [Verrucomicrobiales bacterium]|nr:hypothetical protein [Verrucomicrobiales bacterium]